MDQFLLGDGEQFLREIVTPEGRHVSEFVFTNPYTGEIHRLVRVSETRYDPATGRPEIHEQVVVPTGIDGALLLDLHDISICAEGGEPVSRIHSVVDPFCGRILCLMHSEMADVDGVPLRVCEGCARAIKRANRKKAILEFFFGKRT